MLDRYYQALILRLKSEAKTKARAPDPPTVRRLRDAQRKWLVYRDDECRKRTSAREGPLWAPVRAKCLAEYSALRAPGARRRADEAQGALEEQQRAFDVEAAERSQTDSSAQLARVIAHGLSFGAVIADP